MTVSERSTADPAAHPPPGDSTLRSIRRSEKGWLARWARWLTIVLLAAVVGVAATGWLGVHTTSATASGGGYRITVTYASVARAGLDVPLRVQVDKEDGANFDDDITLDFDARYLSMFETQGFLPDPDQSVGMGDTVRMTFTKPDQGSTFVMNYDAYIQPAAQIGTDGRIELIVDDAPAVTVTFHTMLLP